MKIEVLGTGCRKCKKLHALVAEAIEETGSTAELVKVSELDEILAYGIAMTPGLVINGTVKAVGKLPKKEEIIAWIGHPD